MSETGITVGKLIAHVGISPDKLNKRCSNKHITDISLFLTNWQTVAPHLRLSEIPTWAISFPTVIPVDRCAH